MSSAGTLLITKAAVTLGTDKRVWTGVASVIAALCVPFILAIMCFMSIAAGGTEHNKSAVHLAFEGGAVPESMPSDYKAYIEKMQESFAELDNVLEVIDGMAGGEPVDRYFVKAVFYSLYFGSERVRLDTEDYQRFADCFVEYEERIREVEQEDGMIIEEPYMVAFAVKNKIDIFTKLKNDYGRDVSYEQQSNAVNVYHVAKYGTTAPMEGDEFNDWSGWNGRIEVEVYNLPASEIGSKAVEVAMSRLGHPYSQSYRGTGNYVDCSYLTMWCYRMAGVNLPGTAAEQARYLVENKLTIAKEDLQAGDLVFWSYKPNGRFMNITHVGVYAVDGKVIDASYSKGKVVYRNLFDSDMQVLYGRPQ